MIGLAAALCRGGAGLRCGVPFRRHRRGLSAVQSRHPPSQPYICLHSSTRVSFPVHVSWSLPWRRVGAIGPLRPGPASYIAYPSGFRASLSAESLALATEENQPAASRQPARQPVATTPHSVAVTRRDGTTARSMSSVAGSESALLPRLPTSRGLPVDRCPLLSGSSDGDGLECSPRSGRAVHVQSK